MTKAVKKILIVGSGTAGLIAALILKTRFNIIVDVVHSEKIEIVGVGEGTTEHFKEFIDFVGIDHYSLIKETDAVYKCGVMFKGWGRDTFLHCTADPFVSEIGQYYYIYAKQIIENKNLCPTIFYENKINKYFFENSKEMPLNQFHFDTFKLNEFLKKTALSAGINIISDEIQNIEINSKKIIKKIIGEKNSYDYDFYIDCTGFKRELIGKLGAEWKSYKNYLKTKKSILFQTEKKEILQLWSLAQSMKYGWMFSNPTWSRYGNGYVFDSDYISEENAVNEVELFLGNKINVLKTITFDPGSLDRSWIGNCCAIGLSSGFVEPLEASSIGLSIQQAFLLMHKIINYDELIIKEYNNSMSSLYENILEFISLHYISHRKDSDFWIDLKYQSLPDSLQEKLVKWKNKLPLREDFNGSSDYIIYTASNFIHIMAGLQLFDIEEIQKEYYSISDSLRRQADKIMYEYNEFEKNIEKIDHNFLIKSIRDNG